MARNRSKRTYDEVERFLNGSIPQEIEDDILSAFANYNIERDMTREDLSSFFQELQLPSEVTKFYDLNDLCIGGTQIVDFEKLLRATYHVLVFMNNMAVIDGFWEMLVKACGRDVAFPKVLLKNHVLSIKDLQKVANSASVESTGLVEMMSVATHGKRVFMTWLDLAYILGKLGILAF
ncbi:LAMI_0D11804g1_1 [Lachancea mirantina]|uniref:LAMI_0D11804g1_1 n=1 Tax=Lachancea mirantina TaxID=1230905 RepID=A0A1G4JFU2_9SACH|nr:LAMI_0D11804g1_1 [Lachancea mirantina]